MHPSRCGFDYEHRLFRADLTLNEFKQIALIRLIGCLILNVTIGSYILRQLFIVLGGTNDIKD